MLYHAVLPILAAMLNAVLLLLLLYRGSCIGGSSSTKVLYYTVSLTSLFPELMKSLLTER